MPDVKSDEASGQVFATSLQPLNFKAPDIAKEWKTWHTKFKIFLRASNLESETDQRKVALLLHHLGTQSLDVFNSFDMDIDTVKYADLVMKLCSYFTPWINIVMERYKFFTYKQQEEQSVDEYVTALKNLSLSCEFGGLRNDLVRDIYICGLSAKMGHVRERLLTEDNISLERAVCISKNMVMAKENASIFQQDGGLEGVVSVIKTNTSNRFNNKYNSNNHYKTNINKKSNSGNCNRCGQIHRDKCPADGAKCYECGKVNHFARMCTFRKRFVKQMYADQNEGKEEEDDEDDLFIGVVDKKKNVTEWNVEVTIKHQKIICQIDTGAQANIMSAKTADMLKMKSFFKTSVRIFTFSGERIPVLGTVDLDFIYKDELFNATFFIVNMECKNIIGIEMAVKMNLVKEINSISINKTIEKYSDVLHGLGLLQNKCSFKIRDNIEPVIEPPRKIPFKLYESLRKEFHCVGCETKW
ncbi:uncharacterized protein LOC142224639 [Haematobia irritans]|uniref:uncharacterized protein LOC142224639 n=1 Tax=Haematobia irritans TaxID=7368 RepID=UPI003F4FC63C